MEDFAKKMAQVACIASIVCKRVTLSNDKSLRKSDIV